MSRLAELEAMVQAAWTRGTQVEFGPDPSGQFSRDELRALLGVYADELQELGDPRGELIALDLLRTPTKDDRARELAADWLGPLATHPNVNTRYGLVGVSITDTEPTLLAEVLATRGAPYVSSVSIFGDVFTVRSTLVALAREVRPWLGALRIVVPAAVGTSFAQPAIAPDLAAQLVEATPGLYSLALSGTCLLRDFAHPTLRRVVADDHEDLGPLTGVGESLAGVTDLDVAFVRGLPVSHLPSVRRLDLARTEQPIYRAFRNLTLARQLTHVRLPPLRTSEDRDLLQAVLDEMPDLVHLEVTRNFNRGAHALRHPRATFAIPPSTPWIARERLDGLPRVCVVGGSEIWVELGALVTTMERTYASLPIDIQTIWDDFWESVALEAEFPVASLAAALDACELALDAGWGQLADTLRRMRTESRLEGSLVLTMF